MSVVYVLPVSLGAVWAAKKYPDRMVLVVGFIVFIIGTVIKINYTMNKEMHLSQFYISSSIIFSGSLISEIASISILNKVISPLLKTSFMNAGLMSGTGDTLGRGIGNASYTLFISLVSISYYLFTWYIVTSSILVVLFILTLIFLPLL